ncbi:MAG: amylo-alpha-1,6-glucosidase [Methanocellales archaeon]|nr:amylo-alpha-1,6-glucosidase [Methanocellales archaeon]
MLHIEPREIESKEWIVTNGLGSYASSTLGGINTRKFHGLLVASLTPPVKRWVFVSNLEERLKIKGIVYDLKDHISGFVLDVFPMFFYEIGGVHIEKTIFMPYGRNTTIVKYQIAASEETEFLIHPIVNSRHFYDVTNKDVITIEQRPFERGAVISPSNVDVQLSVFSDKCRYEKDEEWVQSYYNMDDERGEQCLDDVLMTGKFLIDSKEDDFYIVFTTETEEIDPNEAYKNECSRKKALLSNFYARVQRKDFLDELVLSSDSFIVKRGAKKSIIAGYHWFSDWGRDALISLPGLALVTKRYTDAREILSNLAEYCREGLMPNAFLDRENEPIYDSADTPLWYIDRVFQYLKYTNDIKFVEMLWKTMREIIEYHQNGTNGIQMSDDFLISHGEGLTWMDVKIDGKAITPRSGKAVEIQALWYNALKIMERLANVFGDSQEYADLAEMAKKSFLSKFWAKNRFCDVVVDDEKDPTMRPNQIFLASLDFQMIDDDMREKVVKTIWDELWTPYGLRTLSTKDDGYVGKYVGDWDRRERAYHNGTVWAWLVGPFTTAFLKTKNHEKKWREFALSTFLLPIIENRKQGCMGTINEIFDGDFPHTPRGCVSQAWSVAEILRAYAEDVLMLRPKYECLWVTSSKGI